MAAALGRVDAQGVDVARVLSAAHAQGEGIDRPSPPPPPVRPLRVRRPGRPPPPVPHPVTPASPPRSGAAPVPRLYNQPAQP
ncbi:hypothetical protein ACIOYT_32570 [Streptomyces halstedii]|uniref:hypothetical protein n=1 Tax=Streptomyces halstedii TaxID=1944 RepID=UPI0037F62A78